MAFNGIILIRESNTYVQCSVNRNVLPLLRVEENSIRQTIFISSSNMTQFKYHVMFVD